MANERKTETIVRNHFNKFKKLVDIEEQRSDNPKIDKLLKTASKKGTGGGKPEFIISVHSDSNLIIVIECKSSILRHQSVTSDKYDSFAVDGALLYASYLSKEFDVIAIAVSGEKISELKVSHFLQLKGEKKAVPIFANKLLPISDYVNGYLKSPEKLRQDYYRLMEFAQELNRKLHGLKIPENNRALLISCILIALDNPAFRNSYTSHKSPHNLANSLVQTVSDELETANITGRKLESLNVQFGFIKIDTSLARKPKILKELIDEIDSNINSFIKTHKYFDVLGQLYIEFLSYANSDTGLGIVLTPPHITELFAEIAQANRKSIVYDNCTGTGGFLIAAMKRMIEDAKDDQATIKRIKSKQLIGCEFQAHIFALTVSNMYIHQDGKTNIIGGQSCFDKIVIQEVKKQKPNIGLLNPPYKSDKKTDIDELEFILNNLECLVTGGTCVAIVPMQSALAQSGKVYEFKKKLLQLHTLEAVFSMPDELFINSDVGVITCVMVFTAHKPHPKNKETYFGYYKDDGFEKRKNKGRIDVYGKWNLIKEKWVNYYLNGKEEPGFSVKQVVTADDEWCAEAYMVTDYSKISDADFVTEIKKYVAFKVLN